MKNEKVEVGNVQFLGDQDGVPERELKTQLSHLFTGYGGLRRAYLARVRYEGTGDSVALCLYTDPATFKKVAQIAGRIFSEMFGPQECLDMLLLDAGRDAEISKLCSAFFFDEWPHSRDQ